jgi:hypothetical protein
MCSLSIKIPAAILMCGALAEIDKLSALRKKTATGIRAAECRPLETPCRRGRVPPTTAVPMYGILVGATPRRDENIAILPNYLWTINDLHLVNG